MKINNVFNYHNLHINNIKKNCSTSVNEKFNLARDIFCLSNSNQISFGINPQAIDEMKIKQPPKEDPEADIRKEEEYWGNSVCI